MIILMYLPSRVCIAAGLALLVLGLLTLTDVSGVNIGDLIIVGTAFAYACHILLIDRGLKRFPPLQLAAAQVWPVAVFAWIWAIPEAHLVTQLPASVWWSILYLAVIATALVLILQNTAQPVVPPHTAALLFVLEPVFAALFGWQIGRASCRERGWLEASER